MADQQQQPGGRVIWRRALALLIVGIVIARIGATWMRWEKDVLPPWESLLFLTYGTVIGAAFVVHRLWRRR